MKDTSLLWAIELDKKGGGVFHHTFEAIKQLHQQKIVQWIHLNCDSSETKEWLFNQAGLEKLVVEALLAEETRPRINEFDQGYLIILRGINLNENSKVEDMISLRVWVDETRIITVKKRDLKTVAEVKQKIELGNGPKDIGEFIIFLTTGLMNTLEPILINIDTQIDQIEEQEAIAPEPLLRDEIVKTRRQVAILKRYMIPQKEVFAKLASNYRKFFTKLQVLHMSENLELIIRYLEDMDIIIDRARIVQEELTNLLTENLNNNMFSMSKIATVFMPVTFLTGLFGVNLAGIPFSEEPFGFLGFCILLLCIVLYQIHLLRRNKML